MGILAFMCKKSIRNALSLKRLHSLIKVIPELIALDLDVVTFEVLCLNLSYTLSCNSKHFSYFFKCLWFSVS